MGVNTPGPGFDVPLVFFTGTAERAIGIATVGSDPAVDSCTNQGTALSGEDITSWVASMLLGFCGVIFLVCFFLPRSAFGATDCPEGAESKGLTSSNSYCGESDHLQSQQWEYLTFPESTIFWCCPHSGWPTQPPPKI